VRKIRFVPDALAIATEVARFRAVPEAEPFLCDINGGLLAFCTSAFPVGEAATIYAQRFIRSPRARGLNFEAFGDLLSSNAPWTGIFNLRARCSVCLFALPDFLARQYFMWHIDPLDRWHEVRRKLSHAALDASIESPAVGILEPGGGFVLPQNRDGFHWVHEIVPLDPANPGEFIRLAVPNHRHSELASNGYAPLHDCLMRGVPLAPDRSGP